LCFVKGKSIEGKYAVSYRKFVMTN